MPVRTFLLKVLLSTGIGMLIGVERERAHHGYPAGVRTFSLLSLTGMLTSFIAAEFNIDWVIPLAIVSVFLLITLGYSMSMYVHRSFGLTTTVVLLLTYLMGIVSYYEDYQYLAISISIITTLLLTEKKMLHGFARKIKKKELLDGLKFGIVAFIILPLLPNKTIDPLGVINPYNLWMLVIFILSISYVAYISMKLLGGKKGMLLSGFFGGMISSTATTISLSEKVNKSKSLVGPGHIAILVSCTTLFVRVLFEVLVVNKELGIRILPMMIAPAIVGYSLSFLFSGKTKNIKDKDIIEESPFNFIPAIKFTLLFAIILFMSKIGKMYFGDYGIYITSFFVGLADVDALALSMASSSPGTISYNTAVISIIIVTITNTLTKLVLSGIIGTKELFKKLFFKKLLLIISVLAALLVFS